MEEGGSRVPAARIPLKHTHRAALPGVDAPLAQRLRFSVSSLLDILRAMNHSLSLVPAGIPAMEEVRARFAGGSTTGYSDTAQFPRNGSELAGRLLAQVS